MAKEKNGGIPVARETADELLYRSLRAVYHFERDLVERFGLGYQEIYLLQLLRRREAARMGEIAAALGIPMFSTTRLVKRLENLGYVSRQLDKKDRRVVRVRLESPGDAFLGQIEAHNFELIMGTTTALSTREQSAFLTVARNLDSVLGLADLIDADT